MSQKLTILSCLIVSATCMVLHQAPLPLYLPLQYQEQTPNYNFAYEVNDAHTGDYKRQQESRQGDIVEGHYSFLQPDGVTRTVGYRADDLTGFHAIVHNEGRPNIDVTDNQQQNNKDRLEAERQNNDNQQHLQGNQPRSSSDDENTPSSPPVTILHASVIHQSYSNSQTPSHV